jgi:hypothetical protein
MAGRPQPSSTTPECQYVYALLKEHKIPDEEYMKKIMRERWPDAYGFHFSVVSIPTDRVGLKIRISLFAHTPDGRWCFISKRLGDDRPVEFSNQPLR